MRGQALKGHLDLLLLAVLSDGAMHGYAVIDHLREKSDDTFDLPEGTVYPALHRLESGGYLSSEWSVVQGRRRRTYRLTDRGRGAPRLPDQPSGSLWGSNTSSILNSNASASLKARDRDGSCLLVSTALMACWPRRLLSR